LLGELNHDKISMRAAFVDALFLPLQRPSIYPGRAPMKTPMKKHNARPAPSAHQAAPKPLPDRGFASFSRKSGSSRK
jgi:hypothetical protein